MVAMSDKSKIWAKRVAAWRKSGLTSEEFSKGREFTAGGLRYWAHQLHKEPEKRRQRGKPAKAKSAAEPTPVRLVRLVRQPASHEAGPQRPANTRARRLTEAPRPEPAALTLEVGTVRISVPPAFDRETLAAVLAVLEPEGAR
jgi:hypothetical protein